MMKRMLFFILIILISTTVFAGDETSDAIAGFRRVIQECKTSPDQEISFELVKVPGKPPSEPASPEELIRVKDLLEKSKIPYDPVNHKASYEFTLALIRVKNVAVFKVSSSKKEANLSSVRECLADLSSSGGLEYRFE
jgi:hypothetical protein